MTTTFLFFASTIGCLLLVVVNGDADERYRLIRDVDLNEDELSQFSVLDWQRKEYLYRLRTVRLRPSNLKEIRLKKYPDEDYRGFIQGQWQDDLFDVQFDVFDEELSQWTNGSISKHSTLTEERYRIDYRNKTFELRQKIFARTKKFFQFDEDKKTRVLLGALSLSFRWFPWSLVEYELKIFSKNLPREIAFFFIPILDQRNHF